jgi:hypothetical protein
MAVMLPTTFCAGMTLPLVTSLLLARGAGESSVGSVYAANTLGAIIGVIAAVHVLMPAIGLEHALVAGAAIDVLIGVALLAAPARGARRAARLAWACAALLVLLWWLRR